MRRIIEEKLRLIEEREQVRIIHCVESGSRAWGFPSPDSDYDVRFIYVRRPEDYLRLDRVRDVIEWQLDDTLDINGWDLQKTLRLLHKCNPTVFEWNSSPIVYKTTDDWRNISACVNDYFDPRSGVYHYLSIARGNNREYLRGDEVRLKKYFYVLRPVLACKWILDRGAPPPMLFSELAEGYLDPVMRPSVDRLLELKTGSLEMGTGPRMDDVNEYLDMSIAQIEEAVASLPERDNADWSRLNRLFLDTVYKN